MQSETNENNLLRVFCYLTCSIWIHRLICSIKDSPRELEAIHAPTIAGKDATIEDLQQQVKTNKRELLQQTNVYCEVLKTNETLENQLESANSAKLELKLKLELEIEHARRNEFEIEQARNFEIEIEHTQLFLGLGWV